MKITECIMLGLSVIGAGVLLALASATLVAIAAYIGGRLRSYRLRYPVALERRK